MNAFGISTAAGLRLPTLLHQDDILAEETNITEREFTLLQREEKLLPEYDEIQSYREKILHAFSEDHFGAIELLLHSEDHFGGKGGGTKKNFCSRTYNLY